MEQVHLKAHVFNHFQPRHSIFVALFQTDYKITVITLDFNMNISINLPLWFKDIGVYSNHGHTYMPLTKRKYFPLMESRKYAY